MAALIFLLDNVKEKMLVPLTRQPGATCFKNSYDTIVCLLWQALWLKITVLNIDFWISE